MMSRVRCAVLAFAPLLAVANPLAAHADVPIPPSIVGECLFTPGGVTITTQSPITTSLANLGITISGSGNCVSNFDPGRTNTVSFDIGGAGLISCEGGSMTLTGQVSWSLGQPTPQVVAVTVVEGPGSVVLNMSANTFSGVAVLAWSDTTAVTNCLGGGVSTVALAGDMPFAWG